jgi:hypothetical protein
VNDIITKYTDTFKRKALDIKSIKEYIFNLNINSVHQCILLYNCGTDNDLYHNIFYTVYYIINNLPEEKDIKTTIMTYIYYIVLSISMLFWASCNGTLKQELIDGMKAKLPSDKIKDICKYIYNIKDFATNSIKPYFKKYRGKILMVKEHPLIKQFDMKINILVLINIFEKIFTNKELTFEDIFKFTKQDLPDYAKHALTEDALEVQDKEVKPIPILVRQPHRFMRKRVVKPKPTPPTLELSLIHI